MIRPFVSAVTSETMILENLNGSSAIRTEYTGHKTKGITSYMTVWCFMNCSSALVWLICLVLSRWRPADGLWLFLRGPDQHVQGAEESRRSGEGTVQWAPSAGERGVQTSGGRMHQTACLSVRPSVCLLASCLLVPSLRVCTCPTQPQTLNFQQLMVFKKCCTQTENKWTKEPAEVGLEIINKYKLY